MKMEDEADAQRAASLGASAGVDMLAPAPGATATSAATNAATIAATNAATEWQEKEQRAADEQMKEAEEEEERRRAREVELGEARKKRVVQDEISARRRVENLAANQVLTYEGSMSHI